MQNPFVFGWLGSSDGGGGGTGALLTGFVAGAGTVAATDTILQAFNKLAGNGALYVLKTGDTMTGNLTVTVSANSQVGTFINNLNVGSSAYAGTELQSDAGYAQLRLNSIANTGHAGAGSLNIGTVGAYPVGIFTNNLVRLSVSSTGTFGIGTASTAGELISIATTLPTIMSATSTSVDGTYLLLSNTSASVSKQWYVGLRGSGSGADSGNFYLYNGIEGYYGLQIAKATGHATFIGAVLSKVFVSPKAASPVTVAALDSATVFTNEGASAAITFNLPTAAANLKYTFTVQDADDIIITAAAGDTIRIAGSVTAAAGSITGGDIGASVTLVAINATEWVASSSVGTWSF